MATRPEEVAAKLTKAQRSRLLTFRTEPRQMGIGMAQWLPGMVEPETFSHPLFGPHHHLTPLGLEVIRILQEQTHGQ